MRSVVRDVINIDTSLRLHLPATTWNPVWDTLWGVDYYDWNAFQLEGFVAARFLDKRPLDEM